MSPIPLELNYLLCLWKQFLNNNDNLYISDAERFRQVLGRQALWQGIYDTNYNFKQGLHQSENVKRTLLLKTSYKWS